MKHTKRPRKASIRTESLEKLQAARIVGYLRSAKEQLARASAALVAAGAIVTASAVDAMESGIEAMAEQLEGQSDDRLPDRPCLNCGYRFAGNHHPTKGYCFHGGHGEDATSYEPRPANWKPPEPLPDAETLTGFTDL